MDHFNFKDGELYAENVAIKDIATQVGTPFYCYSKATFTHHFNVFNNAIKTGNRLVCFAVKSCSNISVLKLLASLGSGADIVSEGELRRALAAGIPASKIVFSGVGKTSGEIEFALQQDIFQFNIESEEELENINRIAISQNTKANIALRVNPDVDAKTHEKITTGTKTSKFGIDINIAKDIYIKAANMDGINVQGVSVHIGSQITDLTPFKLAYNRVKQFLAELQEADINLKVVDLGGGLGIPYEVGKNPPHPAEYGKIIQDVWGDTNYKLVFEPGRVIAGNAGIMVSAVTYTKHSYGRDFLILDSGSNDLIRPSYYSAMHEIQAVTQSDAPKQPYDIVGPICESADKFADQYHLPPMQAGDLIAIRSCGAYGAVMASNYNTRALIPEVLVDGDNYKVVSARQTYDEILEREA